MDGVVYVGSRDNYLYALDADSGDLRWQYKTGRDVESSPAVVDGVVYVGSLDNYVYALDADSGQLRWRYETGRDVYSSPAVVAGVVYVGSVDNYVYALGPEHLSRDDDHGDSRSEATAVDVGSTVDGDIEDVGDVDFFSFRAVSGQGYAIETQLGSLPDTTLTLYGGDGSSIARDDDRDDYDAARIAWFASDSGVYFISVRSSGIGTYRLTVSDLAAGPGTAPAPTPEPLTAPAPTPEPLTAPAPTPEPLTAPAPTAEPLTAPAPAGTGGIGLLWRVVGIVMLLGVVVTVGAVAFALVGDTGPLALPVGPGPAPAPPAEPGTAPVRPQRRCPHPHRQRHPRPHHLQPQRPHRHGPCQPQFQRRRPGPRGRPSRQRCPPYLLTPQRPRPLLRTRLLPLPPQHTRLLPPQHTRLLRRPRPLLRTRLLRRPRCAGDTRRGTMCFLLLR